MARLRDEGPQSGLEAWSLLALIVERAKKDEKFREMLVDSQPGDWEEKIRPAIQEQIAHYDADHLDALMKQLEVDISQIMPRRFYEVQTRAALRFWLW